MPKDGMSCAQGIWRIFHNVKDLVLGQPTANLHSVIVTPVVLAQSKTLEVSTTTWILIGLGR